jgi:predicted metalloendopeptidase
MVSLESESVLGWGQVWLDKSREQYAIKLRSTFIAKFRINAVVRNVPEFFEAFKKTNRFTLFSKLINVLKFGRRFDIKQKQRKCWAFF